MRLAVAVLALVLLPSTFVRAQDSRQEYLQQFDSNGDHRVDEAEYVSYMSRSFHHMDVNGDDILEASELPGGRGRAVTLRSFQTNLRTQFHKLDRDHDGFLNPRELTAPPG